MNQGRWRIRWWHIAAALALTVLLDLYELAITIPVLVETAGLPIFDTRVGGYDPGEAVRLLTALGSDGRRYYLAAHLPADTALALVEAAAIVLIILRVTRPGARFAVPVPPAWRMALLAAPVLTLIFDLGENALVAGMLLDAAPSATQVALAATLTQAKWVLASVSIALALVLPLTAWRRGRKRRAAQPQQPSPP